MRMHHELIWKVIFPCAGMLLALMEGASAAAGRLAESPASVEQIKQAWQELNSEVVSADCKFRLLWYVEPEFVVSRGGHQLTRDEARSFIQSAMQSWIEHRDPDKLHTLSAAIGVPKDLLDQMWSNGRFLWDRGKVRNSIRPYSTEGTGIEAAFDGIAEWSHVVNSRQVTVYDHSPKLGHFDVRSIRRSLPDFSDLKIASQDSRSITVIVDEAEQMDAASANEVIRIDRSSGLIEFQRTGDDRFRREYYAGGIAALDPASPGIQFPLVSANVFYRGDSLFKAEIFFVEECRLNRKTSDGDYALAVPGDTNVFYSGDLRPGEDTQKRNALAHILVRDTLEDVRVLLPELRKKYELQAGRTDIHVGQPLESRTPPKPNRAPVILLVNGVVISLLIAVALVRRMIHVPPKKP
jgi:hypothetical protein